MLPMTGIPATTTRRPTDGGLLSIKEILRQTAGEADGLGIVALVAALAETARRKDCERALARARQGRL